MIGLTEIGIVIPADNAEKNSLLDRSDIMCSLFELNAALDT